MGEQEYEKILYLIKHHKNSGGYEKMRDACLEALRINPHDGKVLWELAHAYYELRDYDATLQTGEAALEHLSSPASKGDVYHLLGNRHIVLKDHQKAAEYYHKAVEACPGSAPFLADYASGLMYLDGRRDEARALLARAEEMAPSDFFVLQAKFVVLFEFFRDRAEEEETLRRMLPLSPHPFMMNWYFAVFHEKYEKYKTAHEYYVKCALIRPWDSLTQKRLKRLEAPFAGIRARLRKNRPLLHRMRLLLGWLSLIWILSLLIKWL
jgi:tetratricopeptide (TPR) repeat protein